MVKFDTLAARCTDSATHQHVSRLQALYEKDRQITASAFFRHVPLKEACAALGYAYGRWGKGLRLKQDYHVQYFISRWRGVRCYHLVWSAIDHIFLSPEGLQSISN